MKKYNLFFQILWISLAVTLISCSQASKKAERNKAMVLRSHDELFVKNNLEFANEIFTSDYAGQGPGFIKSYIIEMKAAFPDLQIKVEPIIAEGDLVGWMRTNTGTHMKSYHGIAPSGKKVTWKTIVFARLTDDAKAAEEWAAGNEAEVLHSASGIEGVYEYLPPAKGQSIVRNGLFVYLFGAADGKSPMTGQSGTYKMPNDTVTNNITCSTNTKEIGTSYRWTIKSWSGDTVTFVTLDDKGKINGGGRALRISR